MILRSLSADDFLRFRRIRLDDLPERALIGLRGPNEAGKTSLGEALAFALFGRTLSIPPERRQEAIRWGARSARVRLAIRIRTGETLIVEREMDQSGGYSASLRVEGAAEPRARGPDAVDREVAAALGFDFQAFRYAFYLGQKEVDLLLRASRSGEALARMIGLEALDTARAGAEEDLAARRREAGELEMWFRVQAALDERHDQHADETRRLRAEADARRREAADLAARIEDLDARIGEARAMAAGAGELQTLVDRIRAAALARSLAGRVAGIEAEAHRVEEEARAARAAIEHALHLKAEHRMFSESLDELEAMLRARAEELGGGPGSAGGAGPTGGGGTGAGAGGGAGRPAGAAAAGLAPGGDRGGGSQADRLARDLAEAEAAIGAEKEMVHGLETMAERIRVAGLGVAVVGAGLGLLGGQVALLGAVPVALLGVAAGRNLETRRRVAAERVAGREAELPARVRELERVRAGARICERLPTRDKAALVKGLGELGDPALSALAARIEKRHPNLWAAPEAFLEGYGRVLEESVVQRRRLAEEATGRSRDLSARAEAMKGRLEALARGRRLPRASAPAIKPARLDEALVALSTDLAEAERLPELPLEGGTESGGSRDALTELFRRFDPGKTQRWPDLEGIFRLLRGAEPPGLGRADDPLPWARDQIKLAKAIQPASSVSGEDPGPERDRLSRERDRALAHLEILEERLGREPEAAGDEGERERVRGDLEGRRLACEHEIRVLEEVVSGLAATTERMRARLLPAVAEYGSRLLPRLTAGRHHGVRFTPQGDLEVRADGTGGWVPLDALSGGARDQLLIALRLAFAAAVVRTRVQGEAAQFLFLDEPLASSDETRGRAFLELLVDRGPCFSQVILVTHRLGGDELYDRVLVLDGEKDELCYPAPGGNRPDGTSGSPGNGDALGASAHRDMPGAPGPEGAGPGAAPRLPPGEIEPPTP